MTAPPATRAMRADARRNREKVLGAAVKLFAKEGPEVSLDTIAKQAGVGPEDLDLVELHDCFATAELVHYDNLQLCEEGGAVDFFNSGAPWRDGTTPVNVSGGLQSKGHPIAATGIANIWEVCHHLRGEAGDRQIEGAKVGMAHVIGLGSSCGIHILENLNLEELAAAGHHEFCIIGVPLKFRGATGSPIRPLALVG